MTTKSEIEPSARIELILWANGLANGDRVSKSDPLCVIERLSSIASDNEKNQFVEIGRTECIKNCLDPRWAQKVQLDFFFHSRQKFRFQIFDSDSKSKQMSSHDFLGQCECELAEILTAENGVMTMKLRNKDDTHKKINGLRNFKITGTLSVRADQVDLAAQRHTVRFDCHGLLGPKKNNQLPNPIGIVQTKMSAFLEFYRIIADGSRQMIHRTETVPQNNSPVWRPFFISMRHLCEEQIDRNFHIECYNKDNAGNHQLIGVASTSIHSLAEEKCWRLALINEQMQKKTKDVYRNEGHLHFIEAKLCEESTFLDFISAGLKLEITVAVDFSVLPDAIQLQQEKIDAERKKQYILAIRSVLDVCRPYCSPSKDRGATDQNDNDNVQPNIDCFGFGARLPPDYQIVSQCFPLGGPFDVLDGADTIQGGVPSVIDAYKKSVSNCRPAQWADLHSLVQKVVEKTKNYKAQQYQLLLIFTNGYVSYLKRTVETIVAASAKPISIVIIGLGKGKTTAVERTNGKGNKVPSFAAMESLDSDQCLLTSQNGLVAKRDIVQFVPFHKILGTKNYAATDLLELEHQKAALAREVLAELPDQVCSYMRLHKMTPGQLKKTG